MKKLERGINATIAISCGLFLLCGVGLLLQKGSVLINILGLVSSSALAILWLRIKKEWQTARRPTDQKPF